LGLVMRCATFPAQMAFPDRKGLIPDRLQLNSS
jgi:hypothetical protein